MTLPNCFESALHFTFCHPILVLNCIGINFFEEYLLGPWSYAYTTVYLMAQHTSYEHQMTLYGESAKIKAVIIRQ